MKRFTTLVIYLCLIFLGTGCSMNMNNSAENILSNIVESTTEITKYYAEGKVVNYEGGEIKEEYVFKEYVNDDGRRKIEMKDVFTNKMNVTVLTENELISFDENSKKALKIDVNESEINQSYTQREQIAQLLQLTKDSHEHEIKGEEEINGFKTHHLSIKAKDNNTLFGDMEIWVDSKTWFIIKTKSHFGDMKTESIYSTIDFSPTFPEETFTIVLPEDVTIEMMDDHVATKQGDLKEAEQLLGKSFYMFKDDDLQLKSVEIMNTKLHQEVSLIYEHGGLPTITLSIFPAPKGLGMAIKEGDLKIRGLKAEQDTIGDIQFYLWDEEGLRYSIMVENKDISFEQVVDWTERMILSTQ